MRGERLNQDDEKPTSGPALLESVEMVFRLLDELTAARRPLGVTELAQQLQTAKPRTYRHLASMRQLGILEQDPTTEKYMLGSRLVAYGEAAGEQFDLRAIADPYLTRIRDATGQTALLAVATHDTALVVSCVESKANVCISVKPGNRVLPYCSAQGRTVMTPNMLYLQWNAMLLYPAGHAAHAITYQASARYPQGWDAASALTVASRNGDTVNYAPTNLEILVDSPVFAGLHYRQIDLNPGGRSPVRARRGRRSRSGGDVPNPIGSPLFEALRNKRKALASEHGIPAYVIFHDSVLRDMANQCPETLAELGGIAGVGAKKLETWGPDFIAVVRDHLSG